MTHPKVKAAQQILADLGFPPPQRNERSALTLLALLNLQPRYAWSAATAPLMGITPIMNWFEKHYGKAYAANTRETVRRQTMHQFVDAGLALYNPDEPGRPINSGDTVYQIAPEALALSRLYGTVEWDTALPRYLEQWETLAERYAHQRQMTRVPVRITGGSSINLSAGEHSVLIRAIIEDFGPLFAPGSTLVYAGDTGEKFGYFDQDRLKALGVELDPHGKMPDVILHDEMRGWLLVIESVTSHGPVNAKRHEELMRLFSPSKAGVVYVTAFPTRALLAQYLVEIAWETEVWVAKSPTHLIHFNGARFLGPHLVE